MNANKITWTKSFAGNSSIPHKIKNIAFKFAHWLSGKNIRLRLKNATQLTTIVMHFDIPKECFKRAIHTISTKRVNLILFFHYDDSTFMSKWSVCNQLLLFRTFDKFGSVFFFRTHSTFLISFCELNYSKLILFSQQHCND